MFTNRLSPSSYVGEFRKRQQRRRQRKSLIRRAKLKHQYESLLSASLMSLEIVNETSKSNDIVSRNALESSKQLSASVQSLDDLTLLINEEIDPNESSVSTISELSLESIPSSNSDSENESTQQQQFEIKCNTLSMHDIQLFESSDKFVREFSIKILEFCRSSRLPENQRARLLRLFQEHLPTPNMVPSSTNELLSKYSFRSVVFLTFIMNRLTK